MAHDHGGHVEMLDLDGEVLGSYWVDAMTWVHGHAPDPCRYVLDLGAGTGNGTIALVYTFRDASVVAVDVDETMLDRLRAKLAELGLAERVRPVLFDLDSGWPDAGTLDLTWASMSLHHVADPDRVLRDIFAATRPGGVIAVAEMETPLHFLPDDYADFEQRCLDVMAEALAEELPHLGADWRALLEQAGFAVTDERTFALALDPPHPRAVSRYAWLSLSRLQHGVGDRLSDADATMLSRLVDGPDSLLHRDDLRVRGARTVMVGRRP